jgi:TPP-dependent indolepyruvate ferredoxin oxidoreductase alpha subunit
MPEPTKTPTRLRIWTDPDGCSGCNHCGMDMDCEPFCTHPTVQAKHPYGLVIDQAITNFCGDGDTLKLWEKREPR